MTQNEYDKWYRELNEAQKEATDEFFAWKEKASKGKDCYADIGWDKNLKKTVPCRNDKGTKKVYPYHFLWRCAVLPQ